MIMVMTMRMVVVVIVVMVMMMVMMMFMVMCLARRMIVMMVRNLAGHGIGAAFRFERRFDRGDLRTGCLQQRFNITFAAHAQAIGQQLDRHMAVAEMPRETGQRRGIGGARLEQRFGFRHHFDEAAVIEQQNVVVAQPHRLGEVELDAGAFYAEEETALRLALRERKNERVDDAAGLAFG